jgi:hypothetical protein
MKAKRNSKPAQAWANFCKDTYNADPDDVSDAHELANNKEMIDKLQDRRIKYLQSIKIPKYSTK